MAGADHVVGRLLAAGEAGEAAVLADGTEPLAPAGEQLVGVALVADVPDDAVAGALQHAVQGQSELHGAQAGGEVTAGLAHAGEYRLADLVGEQGQFLLGELAEVGGL